MCNCDSYPALSLPQEFAPRLVYHPPTTNKECLEWPWFGSVWTWSTHKHCFLASGQADWLHKQYIPSIVIIACVFMSLLGLVHFVVTLSSGNCNIFSVCIWCCINFKPQEKLNTSPKQQSFTPSYDIFALPLSSTRQLLPCCLELEPTALKLTQQSMSAWDVNKTHGSFLHAWRMLSRVRLVFRKSLPVSRKFLCWVGLDNILCG